MTASQQRRTALALLQWLIAFVALWTIYHAVSQSATVIDNDSAEAYVWGREFQLGYYEHPPFWAWISGGWFLLFPRSDWAYALLRTINAGFGLWGAWCLIGCFAEGQKRNVATLLLLLTPFYTVFNDRYGGNTIFLSLWPWTAYFFVRSLETRRIAYAVGFGVFASLDMLSKYYALLLLATCLIGAVQHPARSAYFKSASPYVAVLVAGLLFAPHLLWLQANGYLPLHYVQAMSNTDWMTDLIQLESFVGWYFGGQVIVIAVSLWAGRHSLHAVGSRLRLLATEPKFRLLATLALLPSFLTLVFAIAFRVHLSERTGIGLFCLVPLLLMEVFDVQPDAAFVRRLFWAGGGSAVVAVALSWAIAYENMELSVRLNKGVILQAKRELAARATEIWHDTTHTPLTYVSGPFAIADSIAFYSSDSPSEFIEMTFRYAPWVTPRKLAEHGLLIACPAGDPQCVAKVRQFETPGVAPITVSLAHTFRGLRGPTVKYVLIIVPPHNKAPWSKLVPTELEWFFNDGVVRDAKGSSKRR